MPRPELGAVALAALLGLLPACGGADGPDPSTVPGPLMRPGWNCLASGCHFPDGKPTPPDWGAGGTVYASPTARPDQGLAGATVIIRDATMRELRLVTNAAGNFHTPEKLAGPLAITIEYQGRTVAMPDPAPAGSCNFCHDPAGVAKGRIYVK
jgi:hypothetical protein